MMQPFWALPLLGITGLKAKDILPFTLVLMMVGMVVFLGGLILFQKLYFNFLILELNVFSTF